MELLLLAGSKSASKLGSFGSGYDPLLVSVSFSADIITPLSANIRFRLRPKAIHHFQSYFRFRPKLMAWKDSSPTCQMGRKMLLTTANYTMS